MDLDIIIKKIRFKLNKNLTHIKINNRWVSRSKMPLLKICNGKGLDIGCGSDKITDRTIGIDLTGKGEIGKYGCERGRESKADIKCSGDNLRMFDDNSLDYIVARDNIEHYTNYLKALKEWYRVLKKNGILGISTPDSRVVNSMRLDPDHKHAFTPHSLKNSLKIIGFDIMEIGGTIKGWGFYIIAKKK